MAVLKWLSICLTLFCQGTAASKPCRWTQFRLGKLNDVSIDLLSDMGGLFPLMCAEENVEQMFPEDLYKNTEGEDVSVVALEAMRYVDQLYNNSLTPVTWNRTKLNMFQNVIYRQVQNLELCRVNGQDKRCKCLSSRENGCWCQAHQFECIKNCNAAGFLKVVGGVWESSGDGGSVTLKTYFNKLNTVLKEKEHSACAWEIVRKEIRENLVQFKKFIDSRVKR